MTPKERFIELLEEDAAHARTASQNWDKLIREHGAIGLEDHDGNTVTAEKMVTKSIEMETELRALIESVRAL